MSIGGWQRWSVNALPVLGVGLGLVVPLLSLPGIAFGYWDKAEPLISGCHAAAALCWFGLAVAGGHSVRQLSHPYVLTPLAVALWTAVVAPFQPMPWLNLTGAPQSGLGALWFADMAAFTACAMVVAERPRAWVGIIRFAAAMALVVAALKAFDWLTLWRGGTQTVLIFVPSYYGWLAFGLLPLVWASPCRSDRRLVLLATVLVAVASASLSVAGLLALALFYGWLAGRKGAPLWLGDPRLATGGVLVAAVLPLVVIHGVSWVRTVASLDDRRMIGRLIWRSIIEDPAWGLGHGWGRTQDAFHTWLNTAGQRLWNPDWIFLKSDYFHSHNWALESLHAIGVPGMLLVLMGYLVVVPGAQMRWRPVAAAFAVALALLSGLWFSLCLSLPYLALGMAALARQRVPMERASTAWCPVVVPLAVLAVVSLASATKLLSFGLRLSAYGAALAAVPPHVARIPLDFRHSDLGAAEIIRDSMRGLALRTATEPVLPMVPVINGAISFVDARAATTSTILLLTTGLDIMERIHVTRDLAFMARPELMPIWRHWLDRLLVLAPGRSDQAISYLVAVIAQGRLDEADDVIGRLLARNADDPVALYYRGLVLLVAANPDESVRQHSFTLIRAALDHGIERYMPVDDGVKRAVGWMQ